MDWDLAIERNTEALKRILAALVAMAELGGQFTFFPQKSALPQGSVLAEKGKLSPALTLPRHVHTAVLRLLRPAEAATRRLIIVAARGIVMPPPSTTLRVVPLPRKRGRIRVASASPLRILPCAAGEGDRRRRWRGRGDSLRW